MRNFDKLIIHIVAELFTKKYLLELQKDKLFRNRFCSYKNNWASLKLWSLAENL